MGNSMGPVWTAGKSALGRGLALSCKLQQGGSSHSLDGIVGKGAAQLRSVWPFMVDTQLLDHNTVITGEVLMLILEMNLM